MPAAGALPGALVLSLLLATLAAAGPSQAQSRPVGGEHPQPGSHAEVDRSGVRGHTFEDTQRWIERFESPERAAYQLPDDVVSALGLQPGQVVADIGAGSGYFTFRLARAVGPEGRVYAVDIEPGFIEALEERRQRETGGDVVRTVLATPSGPGLPEAAVDLILLVNTYHHISDRVAYLEGLRSVLKPGGRVAVVDYREGDLPVGPPPEHKLSRREVLSEFEAAGFELEREEDFLPYQDFLIFTP